MSTLHLLETETENKTTATVVFKEACREQPSRPSVWLRPVGSLPRGMARETPHRHTGPRKPRRA